MGEKVRLDQGVVLRREPSPQIVSLTWAKRFQGEVDEILADLKVALEAVEGRQENHPTKLALQELLAQARTTRARVGEILADALALNARGQGRAFAEGVMALEKKLEQARAYAKS